MQRPGMVDRLAILGMWLRNPGRLLRALREERRGLPGRQRRLQEVQARPVCIDPPTSFGEKIIWRIVHDRDPRLIEWSDKLAMRGYIRRMLGEEIAAAHLPRLVWQGTRAADIPFDSFEGPVVIKVNNGSRRNIVWDPRAEGDRAAVVAQLRHWLRHPKSPAGFLWIYNRIRPRILIEEHIGGPEMAEVTEIKFMVFGTRVGAATITRQARAEKAVVDADGVPLAVALIGGATPYHPMPDVEKPVFWDEIRAHAITLADGKDKLRVDFMTTGGRWWFGELTPFSNGGRLVYAPETYDRQLADMWVLPTRHLK